MKDMGMTDKQFNGFIRFLIDGLEEVKEESDAEKKDERLQKILDNLQSTLEDQTKIKASEQSGALMRRDTMGEQSAAQLLYYKYHETITYVKKKIKKYF